MTHWYEHCSSSLSILLYSSSVLDFNCLWKLSGEGNVGLEKSVVLSSRTSRFSCGASSFSFSLAQWARALSSHWPELNEKKSKLRLAKGKLNMRENLS